LSLLRPRLKLPIWAAIVIPIVAYTLRSIDRGFDFSLDLPDDLIAIAVWVIGVSLVWVMRRTSSAPEEVTDSMDRHDQGENSAPGDTRQK